MKRRSRKGRDPIILEREGAILEPSLRPSSVYWLSNNQPVMVGAEHRRLQAFGARGADGLALIAVGHGAAGITVRFEADYAQVPKAAQQGMWS